MAMANIELGPDSSTMMTVLMKEMPRSDTEHDFDRDSKPNFSRREFLPIRLIVGLK
jgi:hypothetical protein